MMRRCHQQHRAAAIAAASAAAAVILSNRSSRSSPSILDHYNDDNTRAWQQYNHHDVMHTSSALSSWWRLNHSPRFNSKATCEAIANNAHVKSAPNDGGVPSDKSQNVEIDYYYLKMNPKDIVRTSILDAHAVFGALSGKGLIERYNVYRRVDVKVGMQQHQQSSSSSKRREMTVVDLKLGSRLNGHESIAHGGIIRSFISAFFLTSWSPLVIASSSYSMP